jgi:hypothetical protein
MIFFIDETTPDLIEIESILLFQEEVKILDNLYIIIVFHCFKFNISPKKQQKNCLKICYVLKQNKIFPYYEL